MGSNDPGKGSNPSQEGSNASEKGLNAFQKGSNASGEGSNVARKGSNDSGKGSNDSQRRCSSLSTLLTTKHYRLTTYYAPTPHLLLQCPRLRLPRPAGGVHPRPLRRHPHGGLHPLRHAGQRRVHGEDPRPTGGHGL